MNTKHTTTENIECPQCGHSFAANQAFKDHIQREAELLIEKKVSEINKKHQSELQVARNLTEQQVEERAQQISLEKMDSYLSETRRAKKESSDLKLEVQQLRNDLKSQTENQDAAIALAKQEGADEASQKAKTKFDLREKELLETQKIMQRSIDDFKEKGTNRSSQILGEAGEVYIEEKLEKLFPSDDISEVKKGERGADCLWTIRSNGRRVASIYCEAKNTQTFQSKWIEKLKNDAIEKGASIGIIVTKTMPAGKETFHLNNGILVCNFFEFDAIAKVLRHQQIEQSRNKSKELARDTKANQIFDYIVGPEFAQSLEKILRPIFKQKELLNRDMNNAKKAFKSRDLAIQDSIDGAIFLAAGLEHYLGAEVTNKIGFDQFELLEIKNEGDVANG